MRKLLVIGIDAAIADPSSRGAERQRGYFAGWDVDIVVLASGERLTRELSPGLRVHVTGGANKMVALWRGFFLTRSLTRQHKPELISTQDPLWTGMIAYWNSRWSRVPYAVQLHGDFLDNPLWINQRPSFRLLNVVGKWIVQRADGVRCVSSRIQRYVTETLHVLKERTCMIPIYTELQLFSPEGERHTDRKYVLFVGRLIEEKSPFDFCEVVIPLMQSSPEVTAVFVGEGNLKETLRARFRDVGLEDRVIFTGFLSAPEMAVWYRSARCYVHTAHWEGWGMPMIESLACGCPVVTTDTGCAGDAVRDDIDGFVLPIGDIEGMRARVQQLLPDSPVYERLSRVAVLEASHWDAAIHVKDQANWYEHIITTYTRNRSRRTSRD